MRWILIVALFFMTVYGNQGFTTQQKLCPKGEHRIITINAKWDKETGKYVPLRGRPKSKCVKIDENKINKPKVLTKSTEQIEREETKEDKKPIVLQIFKYGSSYGMGSSFSYMSSCTEEQKRLTKENALLDYSYKCVKK